MSPGWKIKATYGNYSVKTSDLLSYPTDANKTLVYEFQLEDTISRHDQFALQTALLYTNHKGERRIRVHNFTIPLTSDVNEIYNGIDASALTVIPLSPFSGMRGIEQRRREEEG